MAWQYLPEVVEEGLEVLLHLDGVVLRLRDAEDPHLAVLPGAVLHEEEGEQHEEAAVVHDPPDVDVALHLVAGVGKPLQDDNKRIMSQLQFHIKFMCHPVVRGEDQQRNLCKFSIKFVSLVI